MNSTQWLTFGRAKCEACAHSYRDNDPKQDRPGTILRCSLLPCAGRGRCQFAIYAREESFCGMEARHYVRKNEADS